ncbi:hypothetical protein PHLCEN_2v7825 [Hermanssonia centrifuga]|uniref:Vacuolar calcium ion transporter n=1 Tax=Hermanssonia centrifuga TaxID=98765 RepID=A0A2R6NVT0_9APHY|nr:hypothetical protein PHLCEN_2v7825 [Hermanssonia centrifuga]
MPSSEHDPLLPSSNGNSIQPRKPLARRVLDVLKAEGQPSWLSSFRFFLFGSWLNILLVFVPLSATAHYANWDAAFRFSFSFIAIMPLAALLGTATDQLSLKLGQTLSGLLNASFGNAVEIIVGIAALMQGELRIVQTSLLGSILSNLLLVLGCSFLAALVIPAAYHSAKAHAGGVDPDAFRILPFPQTTQVVDGSDLDDASGHGLKIISRGTAILLLLVYVAYLFFQLKTHAYLYQSDVEIEEETPRMNIPAAATGLLTATLITSFCADFLVASIEETAERYHIPKPFIGLILLPIVANAAEHVTSVWMAMKNKMELTIGICVGSSIVRRNVSASEGFFT